MPSFPYHPREPDQGILHRCISSSWPSVREQCEIHGQALPAFVYREFEGYLRCGLPEYGFTRIHCAACGHDRLVAFSCKGRGFCPSCGGRRMEEGATWLCERVLPPVPLRQWVLSLPQALRYLLAYDGKLCRAVSGAAMQDVFRFQRLRARRTLSLVSTRRRKTKIPAATASRTSKPAVAKPSAAAGFRGPRCF